jgi:serine/threonine-protein kinase RsbW
MTISLQPSPPTEAHSPRAAEAVWCDDHICTTKEMERVLEGVAAAMRGQSYSPRDVFAMRLAMEEALVNAIRHGHHYDPSKQVSVRHLVGAERVLVVVTDQGTGFDPHQVPDPLAPENLERSSGRGLLLMRAYLSWLRYNRSGNSVVLCKCRSPESSDT